MKPSSPIIPGQDLPETVYAKDQPEYQPLPAFRQTDGTVLSRWHCTWRERLRILITGDVYLWQMTFNGPLQPVNVETKIDLPKEKRKPLIARLRERFERALRGHISIGKRLTIYGFNAMHVAINFHTRRWGYICFHPPMYCFRHWWPWYFYVSRNATPWAATYAIGPGVSKSDKERAAMRRRGLIPANEPNA